MERAKHPCQGMTQAQIRAFELIAIGEEPRVLWQTVKALLDRGLIEEGAPRVVGRDALGVIEISQYVVPLPIHAQWCEWCERHAADSGLPR